MKKLILPLAVSLAGCALATAGMAAADPGSGALLGRAPKGYVQVVSPPRTIDPGQQERADARCPAGTVPAGGGGVVASHDVHVNINSSLPIGGGWAIDVNNASGASTTAVAFAICITQPRKYQIVSQSSIPNPAGVESTGLVSCPVGTVVLGGGAVSNAADTAVNLGSSFPLAGGDGWRTDVNNASASTHTFTAFAICAKAPRGYAVAQGADVDNLAGAQSSAVASCAGNAVPLGGGAASFAGDLRVNLNSLRPEAHGWTSFENNASPFAAPLSTRVVCAGS